MVIPPSTRFISPPYSSRFRRHPIARSILNNHAGKLRQAENESQGDTRDDFSQALTGFLQEPEHAARGFVGDGSLALHLVFPHGIPGSDLVFGLNQNQSGLVREFEDLLRLALVQLLADF